MRRFLSGKNLTTLSRSNRKQNTDAEKAIWNKLRNKQTGYSFRRQHQLGNYIVDFICLSKKLIIEIDGGQHNDIEGKIRDEKRTKFLSDNGFTVLRFWNNDVLLNMEGVYSVIINNLASPSPRLSLIRERREKE